MPAFTDALLFIREGFADLSVIEDVYSAEEIDAIRGYVSGIPTQAGIEALSDEEKETLKNQRRWALAQYVKSLIVEDPPKVGAVIHSKHTTGQLSNDVNSPLWDEVKSVGIPLIGQITAKPRLHTPSIDSVWVKALYNETEIAILVMWDDTTKSAPDSEKGTYTDGVAVQLPVQIPDGPERPYFLMGDFERPVNIWQWEAASQSFKEIYAEGIDDQTTQSDESQNLQGDGRFKHGRWKVVFKRGLTTNDKDNDLQFEGGRFIPIAFAGWDGTNGDTGNKKAISVWANLILDTPDAPSQPRDYSDRRIVHPAPPIDYVGLQNPFRKDKANFDKYVEEGAELYYSNCFFCHGDNLDGNGHFAVGLTLKPANFRDVETIAAVKESFLLWRITEGGPGLPEESHFWDSAMPVWGDDLKEDQIWKIITFLYKRTGKPPK